MGTTLRGAVLAVCVAALAACGTVATQPRPAAYYGAEEARDSAAGTLFASDGAILSDADIARILAFRYAVRPSNRIAIVALGDGYWYGWSDDLARAGAAAKDGLVAKLRASPLVYDASFLPRLLLPPKRTVGHFREAAARYQADLMLIYRTTCRTYEKFRLFAADKARSYCGVEAVLLDIRSGIVPFTVTATRDVTLDEAGHDLELAETRRRTELAAIGAALTDAGDALVAFMGQPKER